MSQNETLVETRCTVLGRLSIPQTMELLGERFICGFGHDTVFIETREDTNGIGQLDQINCRLQVFSEVDELPLDLLSGVLLLLQDEHVVVEELLQLLVRIVDAKLLEAVIVEDFKTSNIKDSNEVVVFTSHRATKLVVDSSDEVS